MKKLQENFTNILLGVVLSLVAFIGKDLLKNQEKLLVDVTEIKIAIGIEKTELQHLKEQQNKDNNTIEMLKKYKQIALFKNEDYLII